LLEEMRRAATGNQGFESAQQQMQDLREHFKRFQEQQEQQLQEVRRTAVGTDRFGPTQQETEKMVHDTFASLRDQQQRMQEQHQSQLEEIRQAVSNNEGFGPDEEQQLGTIQDTILRVQKEQHLQQLCLMHDISSAVGVSPEVFKETMMCIKDFIGENHAEAINMAEDYGQRLAAGQDSMVNLLRKQNAQEKQQERKQESIKMLKLPLSACKKDPKPFTKGSTCTVFNAVYERKTVAVKVISLLGSSSVQREKLTKDFNRESSIWGRLGHPNIILVHGVMTDDPSLLQLVLELATGELRGLLDQSPDALPPVLQLTLSLQIASGMRYCHTKFVAHRDLKSTNVLICHENGEQVCKISDFGLSKEDIDDTSKSSGTVGTPKWSAPEIFCPVGKINYFQGDVWSFGVLVWEVATRRIPWEGLTHYQLFEKVGTNKETLHLSGLHNERMVEILSGCCEVEADKRMTFDSIHESLSEALEQMETARQAVAAVEHPPFVRKESSLSHDLRQFLENLGIDDPQDLEKLSLAGFKKKAHLHHLKIAAFEESKHLQGLSWVAGDVLKEFMNRSPQVCQHSLATTLARPQPHTRTHARQRSSILQGLTYKLSLVSHLALLSRRLCRNA